MLSNKRYLHNPSLYIIPIRLFCGPPRLNQAKSERDNIVEKPTFRKERVGFSKLFLQLMTKFEHFATWFHG